MLDMNGIMELAKGVEQYLCKLDSFRTNLEDVKNSLDEILRSQERNYLFEAQAMRQEIQLLRRQLQKHGLPDSNLYESKLDNIKTLLNGPDWPMAAEQSTICLDEEKKFIRAKQMFQLVIGEPIEDRKFLDFGCGAAHVADVAAQRKAKISVGFDIHPEQFKFSSHDNLVITSKFDEVKKHAPYDIILLYDVLDHIEMFGPIQALNQIKTILAPDGTIYVRNHPWCSRTGGHLYTQINKAFLHLILDDVELTRLGGWICDHNVRVLNPLETYKYWFDEAGLKVRSFHPMKQIVEDFFLGPSVIRERLLSHYESIEMARNCMEISQVEYILKAPESKQQIF